MESAEIIIKALEKIDVFIESARKQEQDNLSNVQLAQNGKETLGKLGIEMPKDDDAGMTLALELTKLHLKKIEQLIESMKEIQKILFSTRNKRIEEAIKYIEQVCDKSDNNFNNQLRLYHPKYSQRFMGQQTMDGDSTEVNVTTEITHKELSDDVFKILSLVFHPDKGGDTERFKIINNAHEHLQQMDSDQVKERDFGMLSTSMLWLISICDNVNKFSDIRKILAEQS